MVSSLAGITPCASVTVLYSTDPGCEKVWWVTVRSPGVNKTVSVTVTGWHMGVTSGPQLLKPLGLKQKEGMKLKQ